jgi:ATP-dependent Clp protease protease subunit
VLVTLNSPGGDAFEGIAIYNLLRDHPGTITCKVIGMAASAASSSRWPAIDRDGRRRPR